jgi:hypothetical protein
MATERPWKSAASFDSYVAADAAELLKRRVWAIKAFLTGYIGGATLGLWTVAGSSDGVTAGMDGVDRLGAAFDPTKIVQGTAGSAHSWIALFSPAMNGVRVYLLLSADSATAANGSIIFAKAAFTGGTATANPTSVDSWTSIGTQPLVSTSGLSQRLHGALSATGDFFMWSARQGGAGVVEFFFAAIAPVGCAPADQYPIYTYAACSAGTSYPVCGVLFGAGPATTCRNGLGAAGATSLFLIVASQATSADALTGALIDIPPWVVVTVGGVTHLRGRLPDIGVFQYNASSPTVPNCSTLRNAQTNAIEYLTLGALIVPFDSLPDMS